jgi:radical SAM superfamily enzyme YgiQ (UPF0313 family)
MVTKTNPNKMRVALIQPLPKDKGCFVPLGLLCLAAFIKPFGYNPIIINVNSLFKKSKGRTYRFFRQAAEEILKIHPEAIGFSVMCGTLPAALLIAKECKKMAPHIPVIFGGPEVSFDEFEVIKTFKQIDIIVRGEGEITLLETLRALENKKSLSDILGITYRESNHIIRNLDRPFVKDLDTLPQLDFSLLSNLNSYHMVPVEAGRGCPFNCAFCATCKMWKRNYRVKSPPRLVQELKYVYSLSNKDPNKYHSIGLVHDNFLASRKAVENFLDKVTGQGLTWFCNSRLDVLDEDLIKRLKRAGCRGLFLGIESASPEIQQKIKKNVPLSKLPQVVELLCKNDMLATLSFIIGFPGENRGQINRTLHLALKSKLYSFSPNVQIHLFTYIKGSEFYSLTKRRLIKGGFRQTNLSPLLTTYPDEEALIRKYPNLFPSFYYLKNEPLDPIFLLRICVLFKFIAQSFPLTTLLILDSHSTTPLKLGEKIISSFNAQKINWTFFSNDEAAFRHYLPFLKRFIRTFSSELIREAALHEELFQKSSLIETVPNSIHLNIGLTSHPRIAHNVKIKAYNYALTSLMDILKNNFNKPLPKTSCFIAYVPGKIAKTVSLPPLAYQLLSLCNGENSLRNIATKVLGRTTLSNQTIKILCGYFSFLYKQGLIAI